MCFCSTPLKKNLILTLIIYYFVVIYNSRYIRPYKYDYFKVWLHLSYYSNLAVLIFNYLTTQIHVLINIPVSNILFNPSLKFKFIV